MSIINKLYPKPVPTTHNQEKYNMNIQKLHLPGNICDSIWRSTRNKGTSILSDSIDIFIDLVKMNDKVINKNIQHLFTLIY